MYMYEKLLVLLVLNTICMVNPVESDHPPDYDYEGFSKGSDYVEKRERGMFNRGNQNGNARSRAQGNKNTDRNLDDEGDFELDCGSLKNGKMMEIHYYGVGYSLYAVKNPACKGIQGDGHHHFVVENAFNQSACKDYIHKLKDMDVYSLDIVIQQHPYIRTVSDPVYTITCNYERAGSTNNTMQGRQNLTVHERKHPRQGRRMKTVIEDGWVPQASVQLTIHDRQGTEIHETYLGTWIQLKAAFYSPADSEKSFRLFHCRVQSMETAANSYQILQKGCGDGEVIKKTKGFYTKHPADDSSAKRVASSVYFQAFGVPEGNIVIFICDFIVCSNETACDGASCRDSKYSKARASSRGKRDTTANEDDHLARVHSPNLRILKPDIKGRKGNTPTDLQVTEDSEGYYEEDYYDPDMTTYEEDTGIPSVTRKHAEPSQKEPCQDNWLLIGFLITLAIVCMALGICICCICFLVRRRSKRCPCNYDNCYHNQPYPVPFTPSPSKHSEDSNMDYHKNKVKCTTNPIYVDTFDYQPLSYWASPYKGPFSPSSDQRY